MEYNEQLLDHFYRPRNVGEIEDADGVGVVGDPVCGDSVKVWIKVVDERIAEIRFKCKGCPAAVAACSAMTTLAQGKHVDDAYEITDEAVADALGGMTPEKAHCSNLAASCLAEAIHDYVFRPASYRSSPPPE